MVRDCDIEEIRRGLDAACEVSTIAGDQDILVPLDWWVAISRRLEKAEETLAVPDCGVRLERDRAQLVRTIERGAGSLAALLLVCTAWLSLLLLAD